MKTTNDQPEDPKKTPGKPEDKTHLKLDAVLPDDIPPAAAELIGDIDSYQKRLEKEWESAKSSYRGKINRIMEEFLSENLASMERPPEIERKKDRASSSESSSSEPLASLLANVERELSKGLHTRALARVPSFAISSPIQFVTYHRKRFMGGFILAGVIAALVLGYMSLVFIAPASKVPYAHTIGPVFMGDRAYVVDWFRRTLYAHEMTKGAPISSIENLPNPMVTGFAFTSDSLWTVNGLDATLVQHTLTEDHRVSNTYPTPGPKPAGLFFDGTDFWIADEDKKVLFRLHGRDVEEIREQYDMPDISVAGIFVAGNRVWITDAKSREAVVFRLQSPLREIDRFDLDGFLSGATPTGVWVKDKHLWVATRDEAGLHKIPLKKLKTRKESAF